MKNYFVYQHLFPNGKSYIGITFDCETRWKKGTGYKKQPKMNRAIKKYGWENVKHVVIASGITIEEAKKLEMDYIQKFDSINNGYNVSIGGDNVIGTYLDPYFLDILNILKRYCGYTDAIRFIRESGNDEIVSNYWNEAYRAVCEKHGKPPKTDLYNCAQFIARVHLYDGFHIALEYNDLSKLIGFLEEKGEIEKLFTYNIRKEAEELIIKWMKAKNIEPEE